MLDRSTERSLLLGALAGIGGTLAMSLVIAVGRAFGWLENPPPKEIVAHTAEKAGVLHDLPHSVLQLIWPGAHLAYGAAGGSVYALLERNLPDWPPVMGLIYGSTVWMLSYAGIMPKLGLYPLPKHDAPSRIAVMMAAHAVYGMSTAFVTRRLTGTPRPAGTMR